MLGICQSFLKMSTKPKQSDFDRLDVETLKNIITNGASTVESMEKAVKALGRRAESSLIDFVYGLISAEWEMSILEEWNSPAQIFSTIPSLVRREAVSALGRIRDGRVVGLLCEILHKDKDPKVLCQTMRGLRRFANDKEFKEYKETIMSEMDWATRNMTDEWLKKFAASPLRRSRKAAMSTTDVMPHKKVLDGLKDLVALDDSKYALSLLPDGCVHLTFTSPPYYNARDYSIYPSYEAYLDKLSDIFKEVLRVTKQGRFLVVNTSPVIMPRMSRAHQSRRYPITFDLHARLTSMGWEFVDDIIWEKPEYSVKNRIGQFFQHHKPLTYKPNSVTEYVMVYRKPSDRLIDWNLKQYDKDVMEESKVFDNIDTTNIWKIPPVSSKKHSAVFPVELCEKVIKYYSFKGDLVLDPFAGSGTVAVAAHNLGRHFAMFECNMDYCTVMCDNLRSRNIPYTLTCESFEAYLTSRDIERKKNEDENN